MRLESLLIYNERVLVRTYSTFLLVVYGQNDGEGFCFRDQSHVQLIRACRQNDLHAYFTTCIFVISNLIQFYVPFKLFHSYRDESIGRWGENRSTRGKTT